MLSKQVAIELDTLNGVKMVCCSKEAIAQYKDQIIKMGIPVFHKKTNGELITIPLKVFENYAIGEIKDFYLEESCVLNLNQALLLEKQKAAQKQKAVPKKKGFKDIVHYVEKLTMDERLGYLQKSINLFNELKRDKTLRNFQLVDQAATGLARVVLINNISLNDQDVSLELDWPEALVHKFVQTHNCFRLNGKTLSYVGFFQHQIFMHEYVATPFINEEQKKDLLVLAGLAGKQISYKVSLIKANIKIIDELMDLFKKRKIAYKDVTILNKRITGSTVMDHSVRTTFLFMLFADFVNEYLGNSGANKIRREFAASYLPYYQRIMPGQEITLERIFKGGIRTLDKDVIQNCVLGAALHDISKYSDLDYHDGEEPFDFEKVNNHALKGYLLLANLLNRVEPNDHYYNPAELSLMIAQHHDYYDYIKKEHGTLSAGMILHQKYMPYEAREKIRYFISYDAADFFKKEKERALVFFPAKLLEIIDVFDALTDLNKKRGAKLTTEGALKLMKEDFLINKNKLDPILFNIFVLLLNEKYKKLQNLTDYLYKFPLHR